MRLADLQASLAASLAAGRPAPAGCDARSLERARRALIAKRRRAAGHLLPRVRAALGKAWSERFTDHAGSYNPCGQLHHVDDAWELAETLCREDNPRLAAAAHDDLVGLRLRFVRRRSASAGRIRERRGLLVARLLSAPDRIVIRLPGSGRRVIEIPWALPPDPSPASPSPSPGEGETSQQVRSWKLHREKRGWPPSRCRE